MLKQFKEFAMKGNVVDMAVGVIIGGAFGKIITSLVSDVIMPPIGLLIGNVDFSDLVLTLHKPLGDAKPVTINYGIFINNVINFLIVAFSIFLVVKAVTSFKKKEEAPASTTRECPQCLSIISKKASRCAFCTSNIQPA